MNCKHFGVCGGCVYLNKSYEEELALKENGVKELLAPFNIKEWEGICPAPSRDAYRNKMEFAFGDEYKDGPLALGIRKKRNFYEVATPSECVLINDDFKIILNCVLQTCRESGETFFHRKRHVGTLRHLVLRRGAFTGELLINLVTTSQSTIDMTAMTEGIKKLPLSGKPMGILHSINDGVADAVKNENVNIIYGCDTFFEKIGGLDFKISAFSFFQTNSAGAEVLYDKVRNYCAEGGVAYDLYCGTGTIAQLLANKFESVTGVELNPDAVQAAKENAALNKINNCHFIAGDVMQVVDTLAEPPNVVVVDPPRDGLHPKSLPKIAGLGMKQMVYVSCKPSSLARDLGLLEGYGYKAVKAGCVDMFPYTPHVETVVGLLRE